MRKTVWANGLALTAAAILASTGTANAVGNSMSTDATFKVGVDIQPGVYKTTTAATVCAWARLSAITPDANATIQAGGAVNGTVTVEIKPTDVAFFTSGCGTWTLQTTTTSTGSSGLSNLISGSASGSSLLSSGSASASS